MLNLQGNDGAIRDLLTQAQVIAVVGHSDRPDRTSYQIAQFLRRVGYTVYPVNPMVATIDGQPSYPSLQAVPEVVDIVNVFRRSEHLPAIVEEAIASRTQAVWAQLGVTHPLAAQRAQEAGLTMVMDACIQVEYLRLQVQRSA